MPSNNVQVENEAKAVFKLIQLIDAEAARLISKHHGGASGAAAFLQNPQAYINAHQNLGERVSFLYKAAASLKLINEAYAESITNNFKTATSTNLASISKYHNEVREQLILLQDKSKKLADSSYTHRGKKVATFINDAINEAFVDCQILEELAHRRFQDSPSDKDSVSSSSAGLSPSSLDEDWDIVSVDNAEEVGSLDESIKSNQSNISSPRPIFKKRLMHYPTLETYGRILVVLKSYLKATEKEFIDLQVIFDADLESEELDTSRARQYIREIERNMKIKVAQNEETVHGYFIDVDEEITELENDVAADFDRKFNFIDLEIKKIIKDALDNDWIEYEIYDFETDRIYKPTEAKNNNPFLKPIQAKINDLLQLKQDLSVVMSARSQIPTSPIQGKIIPC